jgi:hypothetical protein
MVISGSHAYALAERSPERTLTILYLMSTIITDKEGNLIQTRDRFPTPS